MDVAKHIHAFGWSDTVAWKMLRSLPPYALQYEVLTAGDGAKPGVEARFAPTTTAP